MTTHVRKLELKKTPEEIYTICKDYAMCSILDSSLVGDNGRYSLVGLHPYLILKEEDGIAYENGRAIDIPFEERLNAILEENRSDNLSVLPMIAGGIGYFSYDFGCKFEKISLSHPKEVRIPEALFCFYDDYLILDLLKKEIYLASSKGLPTWEHNIKTLLEKLSQPPKPQGAVHRGAAQQSFNFSREDYEKTVKKMIDHIVEGDIYIANLTQQMQVHCEMDAFELFLRMRKTNPSPFGAYLHYGDFEIVSASPERFLLIKDGMIETKPIKGTRPRGKNTAEDRQLREELEQSGKDHSELLMIVDLERNDLNRICEAGSVKVVDPFAIHSFATVHHLVTTVIGKIKKECSFDQILRAVFPGGSITGAPKIESMKIIDQLEHSRRGLYTGSIGYLSFDGSCDLNIVIRTAVIQNQKHHIGIGGGITCESDPAAEYAETLQKAKAFSDIYWGRDDCASINA